MLWLPSRTLDFAPRKEESMRRCGTLKLMTPYKLWLLTSCAFLPSNVAILILPWLHLHNTKPQNRKRLFKFNMFPQEIHALTPEALRNSRSDPSIHTLTPQAYSCLYSNCFLPQIHALTDPWIWLQEIVRRCDKLKLMTLYKIARFGSPEEFIQNVAGVHPHSRPSILGTSIFGVQLNLWELHFGACTQFLAPEFRCWGPAMLGLYLKFLNPTTCISNEGNATMILRSHSPSRTRTAVGSYRRHMPRGIRPP